jgi:hypothetical protein
MAIPVINRNPEAMRNGYARMRSESRHWAGSDIRKQFSGMAVNAGSQTIAARAADFLMPGYERCMQRLRVYAYALSLR